MPVALDRIAYFGERLSENIAKTPEGYLICRNAVIGRSGFQNYKVSELSDPDGELERQYSPSDEIPVWRDPAEVFSQATIASFEGKPFTLTHPTELLDPDNTAEHAEGHVQNVRRGEPLPDGNIPLIADIVVTGRSAIRAIDTGERELSCGYTYRLAHEGNRWDQREIQGNHVALVQKGRAGDLARINDEAPKEKRTVKSLKELFGLGLKEFSKTASPEELLEVARLTATDGADERKTAADGNVGPTSIRILDEPPKTNGNGKGKFVQIGDKVFKLVGIDDDDDKKGKDAKEEEKREAADDDKMRKGLHDALDALFKSKSSGDDAAFDTFKKQLDAYIEGGSKATDDDDDKKSGKDEEEKEEEAKDKKTEKELAEMDEEKEEEEEEKKKSEDADIVRPEPVLGSGEAPKSALDEQMLRVIVADANLSMLKMLKPFVARAGDKALIAAFDTATKRLKAVVKDAKPNTNGYSDFRKASENLSREARDSKDWKPRKTENETRNEAIDKMYANVMASRGRPFSDRMKDREAGRK